MCNAHNHSKDCTCGFGGDTHVVPPTAQREQPHIEYFQKEKYASYVNPNARCPDCRLPVYFYQSENGGRVFFDELGPPWLKHSCTDGNINQTTFLGTIKLNWKNNGWMPITVKQINGRNHSSFVITRLDKSISNRIQIYSDNENLAHTCKGDCLYQLKQLDDSRILISSFLFSTDKEMRFEFTVEPNVLKDFMSNR